MGRSAESSPEFVYAQRSMDHIEVPMREEVRVL
jgi:hypothetical protein